MRREGAKTGRRNRTTHWPITQLFAKRRRDGAKAAFPIQQLLRNTQRAVVFLLSLWLIAAWKHNKPFNIVIPRPDCRSPAKIANLAHSVDGASRLSRNQCVKEVSGSMLEEDQHPCPFSEFVDPCRQRLVASENAPPRMRAACPVAKP